MNSQKIIEEIQKLTMRQPIHNLNRSTFLMHKQNEKRQMTLAAESQLEDYRADPEHIVFTNVDLENFYEAK